VHRFSNLAQGAGGKVVVVMYEYQLNVARFGTTFVVVPIAYQKKLLPQEFGILHWLTTFSGKFVIRSAMKAAIF
jgi:hypothetical protein